MVSAAIPNYLRFFKPPRITNPHSKVLLYTAAVRCRCVRMNLCLEQSVRSSGMMIWKPDGSMSIWFPLNCFSLHKDITSPQPNNTVTPTHIEPEQFNTWNKSTISRKLLKMDVLTFEKCWTVNSEIIKQVTSSWSSFIQTFCLKYFLF